MRGARLADDWNDASSCYAGPVDITHVLEGLNHVCVRSRRPFAKSSSPQGQPQSPQPSVPSEQPIDGASDERGGVITNASIVRPSDLEASGGSLYSESEHSDNPLLAHLSPEKNLDKPADSNFDVVV